MKLFPKKRAQPALDRNEALALVPVKNDEVRTLSSDESQTTLSYPVAMRAWLAALTRRFSGEMGRNTRRKIQLDRMGTAVWDMIDGRRSVQQLIDVFTAEFRVHPREAEIAVTRFLRMLGQRGLIGLR